MADPWAELAETGRSLRDSARVLGEAIEVKAPGFLVRQAEAVTHDLDRLWTQMWAMGLDPDVEGWR